MSTLLRPVGPREPRVYWVRRAALVVVVLIVIFVIAKACSGGGGGKPAAGPAPRPSVTPTHTKPAVPACQADALTLKLSTDTTTYTVGQAPTLIGTFSNPTGTTCKLSRAASDEVWTVTSGPATVWTTQGCPPAQSVPKQLKIQAGATKVVNLQWDGHVRGSSCQDGAVAQAGTYVLHATLDGVKGTKSPFHITG